LIYSFKLYKNTIDKKIKNIALVIAVIVSLQFSLGIITLVNMVPVYLGALHQTGAVILFLAVIKLIHRLNLKNS